MDNKKKSIFVKIKIIDLEDEKTLELFQKYSDL